MDPVDMVPVIPRKKEIEEKNAQVVAMALKIIQNSKL
jgi:acetoin utilization protein AcuC